MTQMLTLELLYTAQTVVGITTLFALQGLAKKLWYEQTVPQQANLTQTIFWESEKPKQTPFEPTGDVKNDLGERMLIKRPASDNIITCYRCGEQAHTVRNCPKKAKTSNSVNQVI